MAEKTYVKAITEERKKEIVNASVQNLQKRPTSDETAMKKRFVQPIVNLDGTPCLADEVDRVAIEADQAFRNVDASITVLQDMEAATSETANTALEKVNKAEKDIFQLRLDVDPLKTFPSKLSEFKEEVKYTTASKIEVSVDPNTFVITFVLLGKTGTPISMDEINLPLESVVVGGKFDESTKNVVLTLQNGGTVSFSVADLVDGLISSSEKGIANGVASLDANGKVPQSQLPDGIGGGGGVSEERVEELIDEKIGDIETALDSIIAIQTSLIGG